MGSEPSINTCVSAALKQESHRRVEGQGDVLVVAAGGEGDLGQREVILSAGQRGVQHQDEGLGSKNNNSSVRASGSGRRGPGPRSSGTSPSLSRGGKWKKSDCPRETLWMGLSRLSLLYSFT